MKTTTTGADAELVMKDKPLHALKCFLHLACKAKGKKVVCNLITMHKNVKIINTTKILP